ncbi:MAG TPA: sigma-70 family RNA polymerase sigma factor [Steroidobacteraceae bacterium]|nr:sigma-70 family RNA polymerase sigma factor [Steroidobacteraceae bacterium]
MRTPILASAAAVSGAAGEDIAALARQYGPVVFRAAWRVLGGRAAAEDVQQQVFLRLIESPPGKVESWPAYLTTVATRLSIDHLRRQRRWKLLAPLWKSDEPEPDDSPAEDAERAEASRFMRAALARLNPRDASCFVMRHLHGLAPAAIGAALGLSENHVSVSVHRARKALEAIAAKELSR